MSNDTAEALEMAISAGSVFCFDAADPRPRRERARTDAVPPSFIVDEIARDEWRRVHSTIFGESDFSMAQCSLLAGYCNAVARAIRAEQTLAKEGRYYQTRTKVGSIMRRRHPAAHDAEQGWTAARHLAKQLGITGGPLGEQSHSDTRRNVFK